MDRMEFLKNLKGILKKIEDVENLLNHPYPKHIPAYNKILGIRQKMEDFSLEDRQKLFFPEFIKIIGIITYFSNGRYDDGREALLCVKSRIQDLILKNENNKN